jgi:hypothetical protein
MTGNYGIHPDFSLKVEASQIAPALSDVGFDSLIPPSPRCRGDPNFPHDFDRHRCKARQSCCVSSFIYLDGRFRMIGDTYPFWADTLNASRGPMSVPAAVFSGHTIQAAAFRNDPAGPAIEVTVHIEIEVVRTEE